MAKAALEALNGLNLFGEKGCPQSTIHVDPDAQYRNCLILNTMLPRESTSKVLHTSHHSLCSTEPYWQYARVNKQCVYTHHKIVFEHLCISLSDRNYFLCMKKNNQ